LDEATLTRRRRALGEDHPHTLTSANNLAKELQQLGEHQQARESEDHWRGRLISSICSAYLRSEPGEGSAQWTSGGIVNLSSPRAIFAGSRPRFTRSRVTYEAYVVSRTST